MRLLAVLQQIQQEGKSLRVVGSNGLSKLADLVLWKPAFFGTKPSLVIKAGMIVAAPMGDPNASIPTPQPVHYRPMFGGFGKAMTQAMETYINENRHLLEQEKTARAATA